MIPDLLCILANHQGRENAISAECLLAIMRNHGWDLPALNALRGLIHDARQQGHVIASSGAGYFLPLTLDEALESIRLRLMDPAADQLRTARIMRRAAIRQFGGQLRLIP